MSDQTDEASLPDEDEQTPPHTFLATVGEHDGDHPDRVVFWTWAQTPNFFHGDDGQVEQLLADFAGTGEQIDGPAFVALDSTVRSPTEDEAGLIFGDLFRHIAISMQRFRDKLGLSMMQAVEATEDLVDRLVAQAASRVGEYDLRPNDLPDETLQEPAYAWVFRIVEVTVTPVPNEALITKRQGWWSTWA
ncbi:MAG: hypothetical protein GTN69_10580 [Armatimonadetes bacterium]|nr:hypothetical protein [Armatimonadota bacterium]